MFAVGRFTARRLTSFKVGGVHEFCEYHDDVRRLDLATCKRCGAVKNPRFIVDDLCPSCRSSEETFADGSGKKFAAASAITQKGLSVEDVMLTTETHPIGLNVTKRIEVVTAECAFGMNIFRDLFAGVRDVVGGRSKAVQKVLRDSRRTALHELKREAHSIGANAVVGVDLDYVEISAIGNMVLLVASGTAVVVEQSGSTKSTTD